MALTQGEAAPPTQSPLTRARGGRPPLDLDQIVAAQATISANAFAELKPYMWLPKAAGLPPKRFDWRNKSKVTPVKDQGAVCGDCWAFAATGAYESAYLIANNLTVPFSLSDQEGLDCAVAPISQIYGCGGGWHDGVFRYIVQSGEVATSDYIPTSYQAEKGVCANIPVRKYHANTFGFVAGATIPTDIQLKQALIAYGPLAIGVSANAWDANDGTIYFYSKANSNWSTQFPNGVFTGRPSTPGLAMQNGVAPGVDHDVLLIGWDDNLVGRDGKKGAWIVKNSWGPDWGDGGFIKVAYGTCNVGFNASWINVRNVGVSIPNAVINTLSEINKSENMLFQF